ncbi:RNA polymerase II-associated factor 1 homolog [Dendropsophus ebraccatus]|uniref:RNA polymerase II-associated factor 1 homolog n=1 Tax=Dendropsophus ebraccatus TaxID=150705 RepID=UPI003831441A
MEFSQHKPEDPEEDTKERRGVFSSPPGLGTPAVVSIFVPTSAAVHPSPPQSLTSLQPQAEAEAREGSLLSNTADHKVLVPISVENPKWGSSLEDVEMGSNTETSDDDAEENGGDPFRWLEGNESESLSEETEKVEDEKDDDNDNEEEGQSEGISDEDDEFYDDERGEEADDEWMSDDSGPDCKPIQPSQPGVTSQTPPDQRMSLMRSQRKSMKI